MFQCKNEDKTHYDFYFNIKNLKILLDSYAVVEPLAMMIETLHTFIAYIAMS
jgi:hypothetical protein